MALEIGFYGEEMNLLIKQGATFGPVTATMKNPNGSAVNLTGCTIVGRIRKSAKSPQLVAPLTVTITNAAGGVYTFEIPEDVTATIPAGETAEQNTSKYVWDMKLIDAEGKVIPLYYGVASVFREVAWGA